MADDLRPAEQYSDLEEQLRHFGLKTRVIEGDGNCFFRAMSDQLTGNCDIHGVYRRDTAEYMLQNREDFKDFILTEDYDEYVNGLGQDAIYVDNDSVLAFARMLEVNVVVHQLNQAPLVISGIEDPKPREVHVTYAPQHYNSVRWAGEEPELEDPAGVTCLAVGRFVQIHERDRRRRQSGSSEEPESEGFDEALRGSPKVEDLSPYITPKSTEEALRNLARDKGSSFERVMEIMKAVNFDVNEAERILDDELVTARELSKKKQVSNKR